MSDRQLRSQRGVRPDDHSEGPSRDPQQIHANPQLYDPLHAEQYREEQVYLDAQHAAELQHDANDGADRSLADRRYAEQQQRVTPEHAEQLRTDEPDNDETWIRRTQQESMARLRAEARAYYTDALAKGERYPDMTRFASVWGPSYHIVTPTQTVTPTPTTIIQTAPPKRRDAWKEEIEPRFDATSQANLTAFMYAFGKIADRGEYSVERDYVILAENNFTSGVRAQWQRWVAIHHGDHPELATWQECYDWMYQNLPPVRVRAIGPIKRLKTLTQGDRPATDLVDEMLEIQTEVPFCWSDDVWVAWTTACMNKETATHFATREDVKNLGELRHIALGYDALKEA